MQQPQQHTDTPDACPPWCVAPHAGQDFDERVHRSAVEPVGKLEMFLTRTDGQTRTVFQIGGNAWEADEDEAFLVIAKLIRLRARVTGRETALDDAIRAEASRHTDADVTVSTHMSDNSAERPVEA